MDTLVACIADGENLGFKCSNCGYKTLIDISKLANFKGRAFKIRCKCNSTFNVILDRRRQRRELCKLTGKYSFLNSFSYNIIDVINLSIGGLRLTRHDKNRLEKNDIINISFNLHNYANDLIECTAIVRNLFNSTVCVKFEEMNSRMKTTLGFYLLPVTVKLEMADPQAPTLWQEASHSFLS